MRLGMTDMKKGFVYIMKQKYSITVADMELNIVNDGPVTIVMDSRVLLKKQISQDRI